MALTSLDCGCAYGSRARWHSLPLNVALNTVKWRSLYLAVAVPTGTGQSSVDLTSLWLRYGKVAFTSLDCGFTYGGRESDVNLT